MCGLLRRAPRSLIRQKVTCFWIMEAQSRLGNIRRPHYVVDSPTFYRELEHGLVGGEGIEPTT